MDWIWPDFLLLLGLIPLLIALYIGILRWRCRFAVRYSSLSLVDSSIFKTSWLRRHLPFTFFILALINLVIAMGRPLTSESILSGQTTIILTLDISRSMCMRDITPNRLEVARTTALSFIQQPVPGTQVGIVAFAGFAELAQKPTTNLPLLENALANLATSSQTAIGSAILRSLDAIAEVDKRIAASEEISMASSFSAEELRPRTPKDGYAPHIIVLLTDGSSNTGPAPLAAAQQAAQRGIRIYSIGFGTTRAAIMDCWRLLPDEPPSSLGLESKVGGGSFGNAPDEATLKQIAEITGGKFYAATSALELQAVFQELHSFIAETNKTIEISVFFAAAGTLMAVAAFMLSMLWHPLL